MKDWKTICKKLLFPPIWIMAILTVISVVSLVVVFAKSCETSPIAYVVYVLSFYTVSVMSIFFVKVFPGLYQTIRQRVYDNKYGNRYMTDATFRIHVSLYMSLTINLVYVAINLFSGLWYQSAWFGILAAYYAILAVMRFLLVRFVNRAGIGKDLQGELQRSRLCAIILLLVNFVLSGAVLMILYRNKGYEYSGILIYVMAMYTFYVTTQAIVDIVKYSKFNSPVMSTSKVINLAAALVSMLSLETAMFSQFGADMAQEDRWLMIALTGAGVSIVVITMSVYMIFRAGKEIKILKNNNSQT